MLGLAVWTGGCEGSIGHLHSLGERCVCRYGFGAHLTQARGKTGLWGWGLSHSNSGTAGRGVEVRLSLIHI